MHPLLERQIKTANKRAQRRGLDSAQVLLDLVSSAYGEADRLRNRLELSMKLTSQEMARLYDETLVQKESAEAANKAKSHFLATMSHEIRTPMNGILGFASILGGTELDLEQQDAVNIITDSGQNLLSILNDILDLSKIETNSIELESLEFELEELVNNCANVFLAQASLKGLDLSIFIDPALPTIVTGDYGRISQILNNLISNAIKFTDSGSIGISVVAKDQESQETTTAVDITFSVIDSGIGFSQEIKSHLFKEFTQADSSTTRKFGGTGLGLSISQKLTTLMGGNIQAKSKEGKGSTFWFTIPFKTLKPPAASLFDQLSCACFQERKVLIVDDNKINRSFFKQLLSAYGMDCEAVSSVNKALKSLAQARAKGQQYDLAIIDHLMPEKDGLLLAREMRNAPAYQHIPLILSSSSGHISQEHALEIGFDAIAHKPIRQSHLLNTLAGLIREKLPKRAVEENHCANNKKPAHKIQIIKTQPPVPASKGYILVAEDNAINQKVIQKVLTKAGYRLEFADNGKEAVKMVQKYDFDLIVMDIQMPKLSGRQATIAIRSLPIAANTIPIIAATANAMAGDKEKCFAVGMDAYISKPFDPNDLLAKIADLMPNNSAKEEHANTEAALPEVKKQQQKLANVAWAI